VIDDAVSRGNKETASGDSKYAWHRYRNENVFTRRASFTLASTFRDILIFSTTIRCLRGISLIISDATLFDAPRFETLAGLGIAYERSHDNSEAGSFAIKYDEYFL